MKPPKEKTAKKKTINGMPHACQFGATADTRYEKCYFCPNIRIKRV